MNSSFDDSLLSDEVLKQLEFETRLDFAHTFEELYLIPLENALKTLLSKKCLASIQRIGHMIGGHGEFMSFVPMGESLEKHAKDMLEKNYTDKEVLLNIAKKIRNQYLTEIIPFLKKNA